MYYKKTTFIILIAYYFLVALIAFWYIHADEHMQIFEFASYKAGITPLDALAWEFQARIRTSILPFFAFLLIKGFGIVGVGNPFVIESFSRVLSTALFIFSLYRLAPFFLEQLNDEGDKKKLVLFTLCFWLFPTYMIRFNSESLSASFFWIAFSIFDYRKTSSPQKGMLLLTGVLIGFSFYFRFQIAFLILILFIWSLIFLKNRFLDWLFIGIGAMLPFCIELITNFWLYGEFVFTPYHYFEQNIIHNVAASFGTEPFYYYFQCIFLFSFPLIGIFLLVGTVLYIIKFNKSVFTYLLAGFIGVHSIIGHKEFRFISPVFTILVPMAFIGFYYGFKNRKLVNNSIKAVIIMNLLLLPTALIVKSPRMMNYFILYFDTLHEERIYYDFPNPYGLSKRFPDTKHYFYKRKDLKVIETKKDSLSAGQNYFFTRHYYGESFIVNKIKYKRTYQTLPPRLVAKIPPYIEDGVGSMYIYKSK